MKAKICLAKRCESFPMYGIITQFSKSFVIVLCRPNICFQLKDCLISDNFGYYKLERISNEALYKFVCDLFAEKNKNKKK